MSKLIIEDPDLYKEFEVKEDGRIYLGKEWSGKEVKISVEEVPATRDDDGADGE